MKYKNQVVKHTIFILTRFAEFYQKSKKAREHFDKTMLQIQKDTSNKYQNFYKIDRTITSLKKEYMRIMKQQI